MASGLEDTLLSSPPLFLSGCFDADWVPLLSPNFAIPHPLASMSVLGAWKWLSSSYSLSLLHICSYSHSSPGNHSLSPGWLVSHFLGSQFYAGFSGSLLDV